MATQYFLRNAASDLGGAGQKALSTVRGAASTTAVTSTVASGTNIPVTQTGGGQALTWFSPPLSAQSISGTVDVNIRGLEAANTVNAGAGILIERTNNAGVVQSTILADATIPTTATEYGLTDAALTQTALAITATTFAAGDRVKVTLKVRNFGTMAANASGVTNSYDGPTAAVAGDTYVTFSANILAPVSADLDLRWKVNAQVTQSLDLRWRTAAVVTADIDLRWRSLSGSVSGRIRPSWTPPTFDAGTASHGLGFDFTSDASFQADGVWWYHPTSGTVPPTVRGQLYNTSTQALLADTGTVSTSGFASGWNYIPFTSPYLTGAGGYTVNVYSTGSTYYDADDLVSDITAPAGHVTATEGRFRNDTSQGFPTSTWTGMHGVDLQFTMWSGPTWGGAGSHQEGSGNPFSVDVPAGVTAGKVVVVALWLDGNPPVTISSMPSGFSHAPDSPVPIVSPQNHTIAVLWKRSSGGPEDNDGATYDFTLSAAQWHPGGAHVFDNVVTSGNPFDTDTDAGSDTTNSTSTPPVSIVTTVNDALILHVATDWSGGNWTPPSGFTKRMQGSVGSITLSDKGQAVAGSTGSVVATSVGSDKSVAWLGALRPAGGATTTPVSNDLDLRWRTRVVVTQDLDIRWRTRVVVTQDLDLRWRTAVVVTADVDLRWRTRQVVTADLDLRWRTAVVVSADLDLRWRNLIAMVQDADLRWRVLSSLVSVSNDLDLRWRTATQVSADLDLRWRTRQIVTADVDLRWRTRVLVTADIDLRWSTAITVLSALLDLRWRALALVRGDLDLRWKIELPTITLPAVGSADIGAPTYVVIGSANGSQYSVDLDMVPYKGSLDPVTG